MRLWVIAVRSDHWFQVQGANAPSVQMVTYGLIAFFVIVILCVVVFTHRGKK